MNKETEQIVTIFLGIVAALIGLVLAVQVGFGALVFFSFIIGICVWLGVQGAKNGYRGNYRGMNNQRRDSDNLSELTYYERQKFWNDRK